MRALLVLFISTLLLVASGPPGEARAAGGGGGGGLGGGFSSGGDSSSSPERRAKRAYSSARKDLERAAKHQRKASEQSDPKKRAKELAKADDRFERARKNLAKAISRKPDFFEAHSDLGFALRSLGHYDDALAAYGEALALEPGYAPAIEYRGEAYLELGRLDEAARAYQTLARSSPDLAEQLLAKMRTWVQRKRDEPGETDPGVVESFGRWVERRSAANAQGAGASIW